MVSAATKKAEPLTHHSHSVPACCFSHSFACTYAALIAIRRQLHTAATHPCCPKAVGDRLSRRPASFELCNLDACVIAHNAQVLGLPLTCRYCQGVPSGHALAGVPSLSQGYNCACLHARTVSLLYR